MQQVDDQPRTGPRGTLYYDGACPLCSAEIGRLRRLQDGGLSLVDIHQADDARSPASKETLLENLHYVTEGGDLLVGLDANVAAWQHTRFGFLWRWLQWPLIRPLAAWLYGVWARLRYRKLYLRRHA